MKIKISLFTFFIVGLSIFQHMFKPLLFIFFMMTLHEMQHILVAKYFHYRISQITFYPFGLAATIDDLGLGDIRQEIIIILAGLCTHAWIPFLFMGFQSWGWISTAMKDWLIMMNTSILIFNCLPVYPLDGGRIMQAIFHTFLPFYLAERVTCLFSLGVWIVVLMLGGMNNSIGLIVVGFLLFQLLVCLKNSRYRQRLFWLYRQSHPIHGTIKVHRQKDLYRNYHNIIVNSQQLLSEEEWISKKFYEIPSQNILKNKQIMI